MPPFRVRVDGSGNQGSKIGKFWLYVDDSKDLVLKDLKRKLKQRLKLQKQQHLKLEIDGFELLSSDTVNLINSNDILKLVLYEKSTKQKLEVNETDSNDAAVPNLKSKKKQNVAEVCPETIESRLRSLSDKVVKSSTPVRTKHSQINMNRNSSLNECVGDSTIENNDATKSKKKRKSSTPVRTKHSQININGNSSLNECVGDSTIENNDATKSKKKRKRTRRKKTKSTLIKFNEINNGLNEKQLSSDEIPSLSIQSQEKSMDKDMSHETQIVPKTDLLKEPFNVNNDKTLNEMSNSFHINNHNFNHEHQEFSSYPPLNGYPRVGDKLAFKILELNEDYCPEVSNFKVGTVMEFANELAHIKLDMPEIKSKGGKFELTYESGDEEMQIETLDIVEVNWSSVLEPKLLPK